MNKKILVIGIVMIIIGIAMAAGGGGYFESSFASNSNSHFIENKTTNLTVSNNITVKSGYIVLINGAIPSGELVSHSNLITVTNQTALKDKGYQPTESNAGISIFVGLNPGTYNYVYFNATSSAPLYGYITGSQFDVVSALVIVGGLVGIAGFIVMIYGAIKREKPKNPYDPDDPYNIDNIKL